MIFLNSEIGVVNELVNEFRARPKAETKPEFRATPKTETKGPRVPGGL